MFKSIATLLLALSLGTVMALDLPSNANLTFISDSGAVVAVGTFEEGQLTIELLAGFSGFVTITAVEDDGAVVTFDATVAADGAVSIVDLSSFEFIDLAETVSDAGGSVKIRFAEAIETEGEIGLARAWEVASEDAEEGLQQATDAQTAGEVNSSTEIGVDVEVETDATYDGDDY